MASFLEWWQHSRLSAFVNLTGNISSMILIGMAWKRVRNWKRASRRKE